MDRKEFLQKMCFASGCLLFFRGTTLGSAKQQRTDAEQKFFEDWISSWLKNLVDQFGEEESIKFMEACGRDCADRNGGVATAEKYKGNVGGLVEKLAEFLGKENCYLKDNVVRMKLTSCSCPIVSKGPERLHGIFCHCSLANVEKFFSVAAGKPVKAELLQSVKRGNLCCEYQVRV